MTRETTENIPVANRKFKDTIFRMLFSEKEALLSLYNAVNGSNYTDADALEIVTLENAIYMGMKNDLAFILDMNLYLYEHQSTINPNIPLRDLFYIAAVCSFCGWLQYLKSWRYSFCLLWAGRR